ncbi:MAG: hypothetical protein JWO70_1482 [Betaproteobacteria bacterium]|nr:hypothetical protein [Betaproteobacteria bacterium]
MRHLESSRAAPSKTHNHRGSYELNHQSTFAILSIVGTLLLSQGCSKKEETPAPAAQPAAATPAPAAATSGTLSITDKLTAYHAASEAQRREVIPAALAQVKDEINKKDKSDSAIADELLPCMNAIDEQVTEDVRATQPILDLAAVCLAQLGYKK